MGVFEKAAKQKLRFSSDRGLLTVEDLYDLPLKGKVVSLDNLAKAINRKLKEEDEESFVDTASNVNTTLNLQLDILKHIIVEKVAERDAAVQEASKKAQREQLETALSAAQQRDLLNKTPDEIKAMLDNL